VILIGQLLRGSYSVDRACFGLDAGASGFELRVIRTGLTMRIWVREPRCLSLSMSRSETSRHSVRRFLVGAAIGLTVVILFGVALV